MAQVRDIGMRVGGITKVRIDNSMRYDFSASGVNFAASIAEASANGGPDRPMSVAANYKAGPLFVGAGYEDPAGANDKQWNLAATYALGSNTVSAGYVWHHQCQCQGHRLCVGPERAGGCRGGQGGLWHAEVGSTTTASKFGLGYHHSLSKRTLIYADVGHDSKATTAKSGYDLGIRHSF